jgi:protein TonB
MQTKKVFSGLLCLILCGNIFAQNDKIANEIINQTDDTVKFHTFQNDTANYKIAKEIVNQTDDTTKIYTVADEMPEFVGGTYSLMRFLNENVKFPPMYAEMGIQGRVICRFVVEKDGSITNIEILKSLDPALDKEAVRVIGIMPKWKPAKQNGQPVRCYYNLPVEFKL